MPVANEDAEFEQIKSGIERATEVLAKAVEEHGAAQWDYLIVAVPTGRPSTRIAMMASVPVKGLPMFLTFILNAFKSSAVVGRVIDDTKPEGKPS